MLPLSRQRPFRMVLVLLAAFLGLAYLHNIGVTGRAAHEERVATKGNEGPELPDSVTGKLSDVKDNGGENRSAMPMGGERVAESTNANAMKGSGFISNGKPSINLVIASTLSDDVSWTTNLKIPNLKVIRYIADDPTAEYHPKLNRGNEANIYHTYMHAFYDSLPDITIFTHAEDRSWRTDSVLSGSLATAIQLLNLNEVHRRGYVSLRVDWTNACPDGINTTRTWQLAKKEGRWSSWGTTTKEEEPYMREAFLENFQSSNGSVPEILAQPCCSQFAATREAIQRVPKSQYAHHIAWFADKRLPEKLSARIWEHMWQYLFSGRAVDCPMPWKTYCLLYGICFRSAVQLQDFVTLEENVVRVLEEKEQNYGWFGRRGLSDQDMEKLKQARKTAMDWKNLAIVRGIHGEWKDNVVGDIYAQ
jgi:hypothetical protein